MTTADKAPKKSFGAFKNVEGSQAQIDLNILRSKTVLRQFIINKLISLINFIEI